MEDAGWDATRSTGDGGAKGAAEQRSRGQRSGDGRATPRCDWRRRAWETRPCPKQRSRAAGGSSRPLGALTLSPAPAPHHSGVLTHIPLPCRLYLKARPPTSQLASPYCRSWRICRGANSCCLHTPIPPSHPAVKLLTLRLSLSPRFRPWNCCSARAGNPRFASIDSFLFLRGFCFAAGFETEKNISLFLPVRALVPPPRSGNTFHRDTQSHIIHSVPVSVAVHVRRNIKGGLSGTAYHHCRSLMH
jgi:hypothetical protein